MAKKPLRERIKGSFIESKYRVLDKRDARAVSDATWELNDAAKKGKIKESHLEFLLPRLIRNMGHQDFHVRTYSANLIDNLVDSGVIKKKHVSKQMLDAVNKGILDEDGLAGNSACWLGASLVQKGLLEGNHCERLAGSAIKAMQENAPSMGQAGYLFGVLGKKGEVGPAQVEKIFPVLVKSVTNAKGVSPVFKADFMHVIVSLAEDGLLERPPLARLVKAMETRPFTDIMEHDSRFLVEELHKRRLITKNQRKSIELMALPPKEREWQIKREEYLKKAGRH